VQLAPVFCIAIGIPYSARNHSFFEDGKKPTFVANGTKTTHPISPKKTGNGMGSKKRRFGGQEN